MKKNYLFTPGPTPIPNSVIKEQAGDLISHRSKEFRDIYKDIVTGIQPFIGTDKDVIILTGSGTSSMEAAVANTISPGDHVVVIRSGFFGNRWYDMLKSFGAIVRTIDVEWGRAINPRLVEQRLNEDKDGEVKAVFATFVDTSTGVESDIETLGSILKGYNTLLVVDAICGLGAMEYKMDEWGVDVTLTASQKSFMTPPGLAFISLSDAAWKACDVCKSPRYYFDLRRYREFYERFEPPYTTAISTFFAMQKALQLMNEETPAGVFARHERVARAVRAGVTALGFQVFSMNPANVLTIVKPTSESGVDADALREIAKKKYSVTFAGGQGALRGRVFRIGHMGNTDTFDVITAISAVEMCLQDLEYTYPAGAGVAAAMEVLRTE